MEIAAKLVKASGYTLKDALVHGVSPGFLRTVADENPDVDVLADLLNRAKERGEFVCPSCEEHFVLAPPVKVRDDRAICPSCDDLLDARRCALCSCWWCNGSPEYISGFAFCAPCAAHARHALRRSE
ncbi:MAG TPA: hypothetical protein DEQ28_08845 [Clostridiales bacterium]|nr:hypothetical protein [Clostridiales bacterium]